MKSTSRALLGTSLSALALLAITSAPASAATCHKQAGSHRYSVCIAGEALGSSSEVKTVTFATHSKTGTKARFDGGSLMFGGWTFPLECEMRGSGLLESGKGFVHESRINYFFENCGYTAEPAAKGCSVGEYNQTSYMSGALKGVSLFEYTAEGGTIFDEFNVENKSGGECYATMQGDYTLKGHFTGALKEAEVEAAGHELVGEGKTTIEIFSTSNELSSDQTMELTGVNKGKKFSIIESS